MAARTTTTRTTTGVSEQAAQAILKLFAEAKKLYAPGGGFMAGTRAELKRGRTRAIAGGMQGLAAAGLAGTSMAGGLAKKYEEEVAAPTLARATSARLAGLASVLTAEAGAEMQMAPRTTTQQVTSPLLRTQMPQVSMPSISAPRRIAQPRQAARTQTQQPIPRLNLPGVRRPSGRAPIGGRVVSRYRSATDPYYKGL